MSDKAFDRRIINPLERPLARDINAAQAQLDRAIRRTAALHFGSRNTPQDRTQLEAIEGFIGDSFRVILGVGLQVKVQQGLGYFSRGADVPVSITGIVGLDDLDSFKPVFLSADELFAVPIPPGVGLSRIDIIEVRHGRRVTDGDSRDLLDTGTGKFAPQAVNKTLTFDVSGQQGSVVTPASSTAVISYKQGTAAAVPVAPPTTSGYVKICEILVNNGDATIPQNRIKDSRPLLFPSGVLRVSGRFSIRQDAVDPACTVLSVSAPPGVHVIPYAINGEGASPWVIAIVAGGRNAVAAEYFVQVNSGSVTQLRNNNNKTPTLNTTLNATDIANLANVSFLGTVMTDLAAGQLVHYFEIEPVNAKNGGVVQALSAADQNPFVINFEAAIRFFGS